MTSIFTPPPHFVRNLTKCLIFTGLLAVNFVNTIHGQLNRTWITTSHNPTLSNRGWIGIGTQPTGQTTNAGYVRHNLHLHGAFELPNDPNGPPPPSGLIQPDLNDPTSPMSLRSNQFGVRFGITNGNTTNADNRGVIFTLIGTDFTLTNRESTGTMLIGSGTAQFSINRSENNIVFGSRTAEFNNWVPGSLKAYANINIHNENGLYIRTTATGRYGLSVKVNTDNDIAFQCFGADQNVRNFAVTGNGHVYARRYTTTLSNIPDYVFAPTYYLMSFHELRAYLETNRHLPNVPSAAQMENQEVDLGEMTRLLLEKIEENLLYILQLEERIQQLEAEK